MSNFKSNSEVEVVDGVGVREQFVQMFKDERTECICIASPYFTTFGSSEIRSHWLSKNKSNRKPKLKLLVSLRLRNFVLGSSDVRAIDQIFQLQELNPAEISIHFLDELHAKIYATNWCGIVGSANLTQSGFEGGNVEAAIITQVASEVSKVNQEFDKVWKQSQILTKRNWEIQKKKINALARKYGDALNEMNLAIWKVRIALTRIPDDGNDADYYSNLVDCLSWIAQNNRNSSCSKRELIDLLQKRGDSKKTSRKAIENRIEFIQEIGLIKKHNTRYRVTPLGATLNASYDSRWQFFKLLFRWCEQNGDSQLRVLLKAVDKKFTVSSSVISLKEVRKAIPLSKRKDYWERPSKMAVSEETSYKQFRVNSCHARNWLKSLDILRLVRRKNATHYALGDLYKFYLLPEKRQGVTLDERLNEITARIDD